jgi:hypothetical protein
MNQIEAITGRYVHVQHGGRNYRTYFEENVPLCACTPLAPTASSFDICWLIRRSPGVIASSRSTCLGTDVPCRRTAGGTKSTSSLATSTL